MCSLSTAASLYMAMLEQAIPIEPNGWNPPRGRERDGVYGVYRAGTGRFDTRPISHRHASFPRRATRSAYVTTAEQIGDGRDEAERENRPTKATDRDGGDPKLPNKRVAKTGKK